ncbi:MAG: DUF2207 domain-containing protein [Patescibacteria group bacterium]
MNITGRGAWGVGRGKEDWVRGSAYGVRGWNDFLICNIKKFFQHHAPRPTPHALLLIFAFLFLPTVVSAQTNEHIVSFDAAAQIQADRTATITETILYDFGTSSHHGIYRDIPTQYQRNGGNYSLKLSHVSVKIDGEPVAFSIQSKSPIFDIRIGDPNSLLSGIHVYVISYQTDRAINFFKDGHAEFYWNVTGDGWDVPILASTFRVIGPSAYTPAASDAICFTGPTGSTEQKCASEVSGNQIAFSSSRSLSAGEGWTIDASFPKGVITPPSFLTTISQIVSDNWILGFPILTFIVMFFVWSKFGKDPKGTGTVIPQYEPPRGMAPMEMDALWHEDVRHQAVTATILDLARRGYLTISYGGKEDFDAKDVSFDVKKPIDDTLTEFEKEIYNGMFVGSTHATFQSIRNTFAKYIALAKRKAFASLQSKQFITVNPIATRSAYTAGAAIGGFLLFKIFENEGVIAIISVIASAIIVCAFGWLMPKKTKDGAIALEEIKGFKWFLSVTEKDRLAFTDAPKLKPEQFHAFLPYAIVFGVENEWAKQFAGMQVPQPEYVHGMNVWDVMIFSHMMHTLDARAAVSAYVPPQQSGAGRGMSGFGGGGFSGGGFGGGGGGSW